MRSFLFGSLFLLLYLNNRYELCKCFDRIHIHSLSLLQRRLLNCGHWVVHCGRETELWSGIEDKLIQLIEWHDFLLEEVEDFLCLPNVEQSGRSLCCPDPQLSDSLGVPIDKLCLLGVELRDFIHEFKNHIEDGQFLLQGHLPQCAEGKDLLHQCLQGLAHQAHRVQVLGEVLGIHL